MHLELDARGSRYLERFRKIAFALPEPKSLREETEG